MSDVTCIEGDLAVVPITHVLAVRTKMLTGKWGEISSHNKFVVQALTMEWEIDLQLFEDVDDAHDFMKKMSERLGP